MNLNQDASAVPLQVENAMVMHLISHKPNRQLP
jgi:hypothetical protein